MSLSPNFSRPNLAASLGDVRVPWMTQPIPRTRIPPHPGSRSPPSATACSHGLTVHLVIIRNSFTPKLCPPLLPLGYSVLFQPSRHPLTCPSAWKNIAPWALFISQLPVPGMSLLSTHPSAGLYIYYYILWEYSNYTIKQFTFSIIISVEALLFDAIEIRSWSTKSQYH